MIQETKPIQQLTESELIKRYARHRDETDKILSYRLTNLSDYAFWESASKVWSEASVAMRVIYMRALKPLVVSACNSRFYAHRISGPYGYIIPKQYVLSRLRRRYRKVFKSLKQQNLRAKNLK